MDGDAWASSRRLQPRTPGRDWLGRFFLDIIPQVDENSGEPQFILFGSFYQTKVTLWNCTVQLNTRNVTAKCLPGASTPMVCDTQKIGRSKFPISTLLNNPTTAHILSDLWPLSDKASSNFSSHTEQFIVSGWEYSLADRLVDLSRINNITFATRLTTLFNT
jgi:hypothetical protein